MERFQRVCGPILGSRGFRVANQAVRHVSTISHVRASDRIIMSQFIEGVRNGYDLTYLGVGRSVLPRANFRVLGVSMGVSYYDKRLRRKDIERVASTPSALRLVSILHLGYVRAFCAQHSRFVTLSRPTRVVGVLVTLC